MDPMLIVLLKRI